MNASAFMRRCSAAGPSKSFFQLAKRHLPAERRLTASKPWQRRSYSQTRTVRGPSSIPGPVPVGIDAALRAASDPSFKPRSTLFKDEFSLRGRVAVVTGGHRGIGLDIAEALAEAGATAYCLDLPETPDDTWRATQRYVARIAETEAENGIGRLEYASADVTDQKGIWAAVGGIAAKEGGRLDVCVAAAGTLGAHSCLDYPAEEWERILRVNTTGVMYTAQAAARQMVAQNRGAGSIILVASLSSQVAVRGADASAYATSKAAVVQMARSLACELGPKGIRVNSLSPGYIKTPMTQPYGDALYDEWASQNPLGRIGETKELRGVVSWLASDAGSFCTGSDIPVSGGHHAW